MNYTSPAIALSYLKYSKSSIIARLFTKEHGLQSFIVKGVRSSKSKNKLGFFQPLQLLQITGSLVVKHNIQHLTNVTLANTKLPSIVNIKNTFISIFFAEVLVKSLQENQKDEKLFNYIWKIKVSLNNNNTLDANFVLIFLLKLTCFFGFSPSKDNILLNYFDLQTGDFVTKENSYTLNINNSKYLKCLITEKKCFIPYQNRKDLLKSIIKYYKLQHHELKNITSHLIIESLKS